jgi:hypothetical protein
MPADLTSAGLFRRESYLITDEYLLVLESGFASDRVRRLRFDRVESIVVWGRPAGGVQFFGIVTAAFGFVLGLSNVVAGWFIAGAGALIFARFALCYKYKIRITRAGVRKDIVCTVRPGRVHRFLEQLGAAIDAAQGQAGAKAESAPQTTEEPPTPQL